MHTALRDWLSTRAARHIALDPENIREAAVSHGIALASLLRLRWKSDYHGIFIRCIVKTLICIILSLHWIALSSLASAHMASFSHDGDEPAHVHLFGDPHHDAHSEFHHHHDADAGDDGHEDIDHDDSSHADFPPSLLEQMSVDFGSSATPRNPGGSWTQALTSPTPPLPPPIF